MKLSVSAIIYPRWTSTVIMALYGCVKYLHGFGWDLNWTFIYLKQFHIWYKVIINQNITWVTPKWIRITGIYFLNGTSVTAKSNRKVITANFSPEWLIKKNSLLEELHPIWVSKGVQGVMGLVGINLVICVQKKIPDSLGVSISFKISYTLK